MTNRMNPSTPKLLKKDHDTYRIAYCFDKSFCTEK